METEIAATVTLWFDALEVELEVAPSVAAPVRTTVPPSAAEVCWVTSLVIVTPLPPNALTRKKLIEAVEVFVDVAVALRVDPCRGTPGEPAAAAPGTAEG